MTYKEKLLDPRWQKARLRVLERDEFRCRHCLSIHKTLHVHHLDYTDGHEPWEYPLDYFLTLCEDCHREETEGRKATERRLLSSFRLKFKDSFSKECLLTVLEKIPNIDYLVYLLWELRDHSEGLQQSIVDYYHEVKPVEIPMEFYGQNTISEAGALE
jgi:hypothetical protein